MQESYGQKHSTIHKGIQYLLKKVATSIEYGKLVISTNVEHLCELLSVFDQTFKHLILNTCRKVASTNACY